MPLSRRSAQPASTSLSARVTSPNSLFTRTPPLPNFAMIASAHAPKPAAMSLPVNKPPKPELHSARNLLQSVFSKDEENPPSVRKLQAEYVYTFIAS